MIGLDTSHAIAFTKTLNEGPKNAADKEAVAGVKIVAAYPQGAAISKAVPDASRNTPRRSRSTESRLSTRSRNWSPRSTSSFWSRTTVAFTMSNCCQYSPLASLSSSINR